MPLKVIVRSGQNVKNVVAVAEAARTVLTSNKVKPRCAVTHGLKVAVSNPRTIAKLASPEVKAEAVVGTAANLVVNHAESLVGKADQNVQSALPALTRVHWVNRECQVQRRCKVCQVAHQPMAASCQLGLKPPIKARAVGHAHATAMAANGFRGVSALNVASAMTSAQTGRHVMSNNPWTASRRTLQSPMTATSLRNDLSVQATLLHPKRRNSASS